MSLASLRLLDKIGQPSSSSIAVTLSVLLYLLLTNLAACSVWHPHKKSNKDKIEKVQRRAVRFVSNNFRRKASVSEMLHDLGW